MYGVLLTGGLASRLRPITSVTNKHLLPVYNKPMIFYGIELLRDLGCEKIIIILGGNSVGDIVNLVRDGSDFGIEVIYKYQNEPKGISHAIRLTKDVVPAGSKFLVLLGDNLYGNTKKLVGNINNWSNRNTTAIFTTLSDHPWDYGQPTFEKNKPYNINGFLEKEKLENNNAIVTGLYGFSTSVYSIIDKQSPSARGELEITDTLVGCLPQINSYSYQEFWSDCGTPEGLVEASNYMKEKDRK